MNEKIELTDDQKLVLDLAAAAGDNLYTAGRNAGIQLSLIVGYIEKEYGREAQPVEQEVFDPWLGL